jgi:hypothetical protein
MKNLAFLMLACMVIACQNKKDVAAASDAELRDIPETPTVLEVKKDARKIGPPKSEEQLLIEEATDKLVSNASDPAVGYWVGLFGKNKINIAIAEVSDGKALGYTVCAGNFRPITGTASMGEDMYQLVMDEPGTDKYDGHFEFKIDLEDGVMEGTWSPFKKGIVADKKFSLVRTSYTYQPGLGKYPQASSRLLSEEDVANLLPEELEFMRNEIYARHGYSFKDMEDRRQFDAIDWYIPMGIDIREALTDIEVQNIDLIYRYEDYYNESYDDYGR